MSEQNKKVSPTSKQVLQNNNSPPQKRHSIQNIYTNGGKVIFTESNNPLNTNKKS